MMRMMPPEDRFFSARTLSGTWFGDYQVLRRIGLGGMGTVYLARHIAETGVERLFAVKVMHDHLADDDHALSMLHDEARLAAFLHHPNVVEIFNLEKFRGRYYLIMEYVEGSTFSQLLKRHAEYRPPTKIVSIILDACYGLHAAHTGTNVIGEPLRLVHRDVSTDNILVGVDGSARIADFGIAKAISRATKTQPGVRKGKYAFMSPEQVMGEPVDHRADLFALGVVMYNALTGTKLFYGPSDPATLHNVINENIPKPSSIGLRPPVELDDVVMHALERDPRRRFQSAADMIRELQSTALAYGLHASRLDVGRWVSETFWQELEGRREAVRKIIGHTPSSELSLGLLDDPTDICTPPTVESDFR